MSVECEAGIVEVKHCHHHHVCPCTLPGSLSYKHGLRRNLRNRGSIAVTRKVARSTWSGEVGTNYKAFWADEESLHMNFVVGSLRIMILYCWVYCSGGDWLWRKLLSSLWGEPHEPLHCDKRTACRLPRFAKASSPPSLTHRISQVHHLSPNIFPLGRCWEWISSMGLDAGTDGSTERLSTWLERFGNG